MKIEPGYFGHPTCSLVIILTTLFRRITMMPTVTSFPQCNFLPRPRTPIRNTTTEITGGCSYTLIIKNPASRNETKRYVTE